MGERWQRRDSEMVCRQREAAAMDFRRQREAALPELRIATFGTKSGKLAFVIQQTSFIAPDRTIRNSGRRNEKWAIKRFETADEIDRGRISAALYTEAIRQQEKKKTSLLLAH
ncbi:hypothetical protein ACLOJK_013765 [Asimina triloba]